MSCLSLSSSVNVGGESSSFVSGSYFQLRKVSLGVSLNRGPFGGDSGVWLKWRRDPAGRNGHKFYTYARMKKGQKYEYPWPDDIDPKLKSGHLSYLSHFKPLTEKPKPVILDFEKPLVELDKKIMDVRKMADETGLDFTEQINLLASKYEQALEDLYTHLTPIQRLSIARHPNRPTMLDHVLNITEKWIELHGDRAGYDDPAIVTGLGTIDGKTYMFIGHQKGRNTKENIHRNFGMPTPHGYRKALRMMKYADHHGFPIITFIDTPGAFADLKSEELGQGEAIAFNLRTMFALKVPIVSVVIGEGGSGGALAVGCANKLYMLENSVFYVASPEACAAILWKTASEAPVAAEKLRITANELSKLNITDGIIPEPLGGAHTDPTWTSQQIKITVKEAMQELGEMNVNDLLHHRHMKYRVLGGYVEGEPVEPEKKRNMKKKEVGVSKDTTDIGKEIENIKKAIQEAKDVDSVLDITSEMVEKLRQEVDKEMNDAFVSMGLEEKLEDLKMEIYKLSDAPNETLNPALKERVDRLAQEFKYNLSPPGSYMGLKQKLQMLSEVIQLEHKAKKEKLKQVIKDKLQDQIKEKMEILKHTREKVARGEELDSDQLEEVERANAELEDLLKSANLEVVAFARKKSAPSELEEKFLKADEVMKEEIQKAIEVAGVGAKVDELRAEIESGTSEEKVEKLEKEIREAVSSIVDLDELKNKVESAMEMPVQETIGAGNTQ